MKSSDGEKDSKEPENMRDGIFLDRLFYKHCPEDQKNPNIPKVWVCYPNLYFITKEGEAVLITHGHYFETFWAFGGQVGLDLTSDDLRNFEGMVKGKEVWVKPKNILGRRIRNIFGPGGQRGHEFSPETSFRARAWARRRPSQRWSGTCKRT